MRALEWIGVGLSVWMLAAPAFAQSVSETEAARLLQSPKPEEVQQGIEAMGLSGSKKAVELLSDRIRQGLPAALLKEAVNTLGVLGEARAGDLLTELLRHRRAEIRVAAIEAMVSCKPPKADRAVAERLSDLDPRVRAAAAAALGDLGVRSHVELLFRALDRGILEAAGAIGQLGSRTDVEKLVGYLQRLPFGALMPGIREVLVRDDLPADFKVLLVQRLGELGSAEVARFLNDEVLPALPDDAAHGQVRWTIENVTARIGQ